MLAAKCRQGLAQDDFEPRRVVALTFQLQRIPARPVLPEAIREGSHVTDGAG